MEEQSIIEGLLGFPIPDSVLWIAIGVIVVAVIAFIAYGFVKELRKK